MHITFPNGNTYVPGWANQYAVATRQDYSWAVKNGTFSGATTTPVKPGYLVNNVTVTQLMEIAPEEQKERCISSTSQFASFAANSNDTVFVGASRSKAQPNIVLLLRSPQRELTLCEHHTSKADEARPSFSPDSRRVYFQSDREGKAAIYSVNVENLVEAT